MTSPATVASNPSPREPVRAGFDIQCLNPDAGCKLRVLVTCPPMLKNISAFAGELSSAGMEVWYPHRETMQTLTVDELGSCIGQFDGWIAGDDPVCAEVVQQGVSGALRGIVKWGIGTDSVDFVACQARGIPVTNTPGMFGADVAQLAFHYAVGLARDTFTIHAGVSAGAWPKPTGVSLEGKTVGIVGLGDIGTHAATLFLAAESQVIAYVGHPDRYADHSLVKPGLLTVSAWPERLAELDFLVLVCPLNDATRHMLNVETLAAAKPGLRVINLGRGALIDTPSLVEALESGRVHSAALDVFEAEPLPPDAALRRFNDERKVRVIFGTHNASNTVEGVRRATTEAIGKLSRFLAPPTVQ